MDLPLYLKLAGIEVQIVPLECADLTPPQAGGQLQQEQFEASVLFGLNQQPLDLLRGQHLHLSGLGGGEAAEVRGVSWDNFLRDCLVQRRVEGGMDAADSLVGESFAVLLLTEQATILLEPCVELLDISCGEVCSVGFAPSSG